MDKVKVLVVEDETIIAMDIAATLQNLGYEVTEMLDMGEEVLEQVKKNPPDLVLLDIHLEGDMDGIAVAHQLNEHFPLPVIFLTANTDAGTFSKASEARPYAFLPKPFDSEGLQRSIELAIRKFSDVTDVKAATETEKEKAPEDENSFFLSDRIFIKRRDRMVKLMLEDIRWIEADGNYSRLSTGSKEHLLTMTLKRLSGKLKAPQFVRVHRSYIVNLNMLDELGDIYLTLHGKKIPIGKSYKEELYRRVQVM